MTNRITLALLVLVLSGSAVGAQDIPLSQILVEGEGWKEVTKVPDRIKYLRTTDKGQVGIYDINGTTRIDPEGKIGPRGLNTAHVGTAAKNIVETKSGKWFYLTEDGVKFVDGTMEGKFSKLPEDLLSPSCHERWLDEGTLVVGDSKGKHLWAFRIENDGSLTNGDRYYALRMKPGEKESHVAALTIDDKGRLYACTPLGIQVFDPTGRLCGVIHKPGEGELTGIVFGGATGDTLFVACGDTVFARKVQGKNVLMKPPKK